MGANWSFGSPKCTTAMEYWTQTASYLYRLELAPNQHLEIYSEDAGPHWHCCLTSHGESAPLFFAEPSLEAAKIRAATVLQGFFNVAVMSAFK